MTDLRALGDTAARRFASWDRAVWDAWCLRIADAPVLGPLVAEGIGTGLLTAPQFPPKTWLDRVVRERVPAWLHEAPDGAWLADLWNIGEGLGASSPWMDVLARAQVDVLTGPHRLRHDVIALLAPVLDRPPRTTWEGPFVAHVVDLHAVDEQFLPGAVRFVAPFVAAVEDRRRGLALAVLVGPGRPRVLEPIEDPATLSFDAPSLEWSHNAVVVAGTRVTLPHLGQPWTHATSPAGYVVATAVDSQRVWVVRCG